jgi:hypothetical protein
MDGFIRSPSRGTTTTNPHHAMQTRPTGPLIMYRRPPWRRARGAVPVAPRFFEDLARRPQAVRTATVGTRERARLLIAPQRFQKRSLARDGCAWLAGPLLPDGCARLAGPPPPAAQGRSRTAAPARSAYRSYVRGIQSPKGRCGVRGRWRDVKSRSRARVRTLWTTISHPRPASGRITRRASRTLRARGSDMVLRVLQGNVEFTCRRSAVKESRCMVDHVRVNSPGSDRSGEGSRRIGCAPREAVCDCWMEPIQPFYHARDGRKWSIGGARQKASRGRGRENARTWRGRVSCKRLTVFFCVF